MSNDAFWSSVVCATPFLNAACNNEGQVYERLQYGQGSRWFTAGIPTPGTPTPRAPQTAEQMTVPGAWTPGDATNTGADWWSATVAKLKAAETSGDYNPAGNFPTATWLDQNKWWLITAGVALGLIVTVKVIK